MSSALKKYKIHPFCELFPSPDPEQRETMRASIIANKGLVDPVWFWCGKIVEGKTRLEICEEEDVDPGAFREWHPSESAHTQEQMDDELWLFIKAKNIDRRHMTSAQIAAVLVEHAKLLGRGNLSGKSNRSAGPISGSMSSIAKESKQSVETVKKIVSVKKNGDPAVFGAVKDGTASASDAASVVKETARVQRRAVKDVESGKTKTLQESVKKHKPKKSDEPHENGESAKYPERLQSAFALVDQFKAFDKLYCPKVQDLASEAARVLFSGSTKHEQDAKLVANLMGKIHAILMPWQPDRVCDCKAENKGCKRCKGRGWLPKSGQQR